MLSIPPVRTDDQVNKDMSQYSRAKAIIPGLLKQHKFLCVFQIRELTDNLLQSARIGSALEDLMRTNVIKFAGTAKELGLDGVRAHARMYALYDTPIPKQKPEKRPALDSELPANGAYRWPARVTIHQPRWGAGSLTKRSVE